MNIVVLSVKGCRPCIDLENYLSKQGLEFVKIDIKIKSDEGNKFLSVSNVRTVPQLFIDEKFIASGFGLHVIRKLNQNLKTKV